MMMLLLALLISALSGWAQQGELGPEQRSYIETHFRAAKTFEASEQFEKAASEYELILTKYPEQVPRVYQNLGLVLYYQRKYEEAIRAFEAGLRLDPQMAGSQLFLGISYLNTERPEKALPHLAEAHKAQPTVESATALGQAHMAHLDYSKAIVNFETALSLAADDRKDDLLYLIGNSYLRMAERIVNTQTDQHPDSKDSHLAAAKIFDSQNGYQVAAIKYLEAAEQDPMNASIFLPLARMLAVLGLDEASGLALDRYRALMPADRHAVIDRSTLPKEQVAEIGTKVDFAGILRSLPEVNQDQLPPLPLLSTDINEAVQQRLTEEADGPWKSAVDHLFQGRFEQARRDLDAIEAGKYEWLRDYLKATAQVWLGEYRAAGKTANGATLASHPAQIVQMLRAEIFRYLALDYFSQLVEQHPGSCRAHLVRAQNLAAQEKAGAEAEFRAAIAGCPSDTQIRIALADYYLWNSRYKEALEECLDELKLNPYSSAAKKRIGRIHVQLRQAEKGVPYLLAALEADPEDAMARTDLARGYELLGKWDQAVDEYQQALELDPSLNRVHYVLARIYRQLGQGERAKQEYDLFKANEAEDRQQRVERIQRLRQRNVIDDEPVVHQAP